MSAPAFGVLVDTEDTRRLQRLTQLGRSLEEDEFEEAEQLAEEFRKEVQKNSRKLRVYRYAHARLEVSKEEADLLSVEYRERRKDIAAKIEAKAASAKAAADQVREKRERVEEQQKATEQAGITKPGEAETISTPLMVPPILPTAVQAMPPPTNKLPPNPPPGPRQDKKRAAPGTSDLGPPPKKPIFARAAGDWKCGKCGWWNQRIWLSCHFVPRSANEPCGADKRDPSIKNQVQEETLEIKIRKSGARWFGDWRCGPCKRWNHCDMEDCRICGMSKAEGQDAEEKDNQELDLPDWYTSQSTSDDYWYGDSRGPTAPMGNEHSNHAAYLGVKGRFKEKKNPYRDR